MLAPRTWLPVIAVAAFGMLAPAASADHKPPGNGQLSWTDCGDGFQCATLTVPLDYGKPQRGTLDLPVTRKPATGDRIGSLLVDFGGPGDPTAETLRDGGIDVFANLNDRYDIVGWDPRGTGGTDAIDCKANQEQIGIYAQPFPRPDDLDTGSLLRRILTYDRRCGQLNPRILPYVTTAATVRDMDRLRQLLGDDRANYLGFSYGTYLGASYEAIFPNRVGRFVLDGALDPTQYANDPVQALRAQTKAFEVALGRFFQACAGDQAACLGFGAGDPWAAYDALVDNLNAAPLTVGGRPVDGDDVLNGTLTALYAKQRWPLLAQALTAASAGDGTLIQFLSDVSYGRNDDGTYGPGLDRYVAISTVDQRWPHDVGQLLKTGADDYDTFDHFWFNSGYADLTNALWPARGDDPFFGPFRGSRSAPATLVVGTTYDPATPYKGAKRLVSQLGNARLLTMVGDGHTAYFGNSPCIDAAVEGYLEQGTVPAAGTTCRQEVPFEQEQAAQRLAAPLARTPLRVHMKPLG